MFVGVITSVCSALSSIGPAVSTFCTTVLPKIVPALEAAGRIIQVANATLHIFGIIKPNEDIEKIGDRAMQAKETGITPEKFESFEEYMNAIRTFQLDPEKSVQTSTVEKMAAGLAIGTVGLENKFDTPEGAMASLWLLAVSHPIYFTADRLANFIERGGDIGKIIRFFEGQLGPADAVDTQKTLIKLERELSPGKSDDVMFDELNDAKDAVQKISQ